VSDKVLEGRAINLVVGSLELLGFAVKFKVKKTLKPTPNVLDLEIRGLSPSHRAELQRANQIPVRLEAGYRGSGLTQLYFGEVRSAWSYQDGPDVVTALAAGDGEASIRARVHVPVGPKAPPDQALSAIVRALGVKRGNLDQAIRTLKQRGKVLFPAGSAISGNAATELTDFCRAADLEWSIQDGNLQILEKGKATPDEAFVLDSGSGLQGSPSADSKGVVNARVSLLPDLRPGRIVVFESKYLQGAYRIEEVEYQGETHGAPWFADIACKRW
jgi:hypothetical protein